VKRKPRAEALAAPTCMASKLSSDLLRSVADTSGLSLSQGRRCSAARGRRGRGHSRGELRSVRLSRSVSSRLISRRVQHSSPHSCTGCVAGAATHGQSGHPAILMSGCHIQDRDATRNAVTVGAEEGARQARLATERAARLREEQYQERKALAEKRRLTFQQKVREAACHVANEAAAHLPAEGACHAFSLHARLVSSCAGCRGCMRTGALVRSVRSATTLAEKQQITFQQRARGLRVMPSRMRVMLVTCCVGCRSGIRTSTLV